VTRLCHGACGDIGVLCRWRALCLVARGGARTLLHRERTRSHEADLLNLVHKNTRSEGFYLTHPQPNQNLKVYGQACADEELGSADGVERHKE
jgi:hypothetical protein